jgi:putative nucleotidyltransferase with HDIG domain
MKSFEYQDLTIPVSKLEVGMHVVALDKPWEETSFLLQGFVVQSQQEIHELQTQCNTIDIQVRIEHVEKLKEKLLTAPPKNLQEGNTKTLRSSSIVSVQQGPATKQKVKYINQVSFEKAVESSRLSFDSARNLSRDIMNGIRIGRSLDLNACKETVAEIVDNVLSNKDALRFLAMIKNKDEYTAEHSMNVCILCATFARHIGLLEFEIKIVALCGLLHDVGKSKIPIEVLNKPGRFTKEEAYIMSEHTTYGRNILMSTTGDQRHAVDVAHSHHERIDGKGYPRCLTASQIPYYAKVVAIVDAYDAMTSERCYGTPKSTSHALRAIADNAGTQFDASLSKKFIECIGYFSAGTLVELELGQLAIVIKTNESDNQRPLLLVVTNPNKDRLKKPTLLNLTEPENSTIVIREEVPNGAHGVDVGAYINHTLFK